MAHVDQTRRRIMAAVRGKDTKPEMAVRRLLHALGYRFRIHRHDLPGTPDIVFASRRKAIFVHGCFWHRHQGCRKATNPKTRSDFWTEKFLRNVERDREAFARLDVEGWATVTVWECEIREPDLLKEKLVEFLGDPTGRQPNGPMS